MAYALELLLNIVARGHVAIAKMAKIQFHSRSKAPVQGDFINGACANGVTAGVVHGGVKMVGRIQVCAVVGGELNFLQSPTGLIG